MTIDYSKKTLVGNGVTLKEGDELSLNGFVGNVYKGGIKSSPSQVIQGLIENKAAAKRSDTYKKFMELMSWTDKLRKLGVRTNSDTPEQVEQAIKFGAEGIGLTRAEHMFFEGNRIDSVREMILADDDAGRAKALKKIKVFMKKDFIGIFKSLDGRPATIRLLDPASATPQSRRRRSRPSSRQPQRCKRAGRRSSQKSWSHSWPMHVS